MEETGPVKSLKELEKLFEKEDVSQFQEKDFIKHADELVEKNKVKDAEFLYEEGLKKFPQSAKILFEYGYMMFENLDFEKAKELITKVENIFIKISKIILEMELDWAFGLN